MKIRTLIRCIGFDNDHGIAMFVIPALSIHELVKVPIADCPENIRLERDLRLHATMTIDTTSGKPVLSDWVWEWDGRSAQEQKEFIMDAEYARLQISMEKR